MKNNIGKEITYSDLEKAIKTLNKDEAKMLEEKIKEREMAIKNKTKVK